MAVLPMALEAPPHLESDRLKAEVFLNISYLAIKSDFEWIPYNEYILVYVYLYKHIVDS